MMRKDAQCRASELVVDLVSLLYEKHTLGSVDNTQNTEQRDKSEYSSLCM